jgi:hypothetical protein
MLAMDVRKSTAREYAKILLICVLVEENKCSKPEKDSTKQ